MKLLVFCLFLGMSACLAQTASVGANISLPGVALVDIAPNNTGLTFTMTAPTEAGIAATVSTNNTKWLNFTSAVPSGTSRSIRAQISGALPAGVTLNLAVAPYAGSGAGALGTRIPTVVMSTTSQAIVSGIGGAFTGDGSNNGYNLTYSLTITNVALLRAQSRSVSIIYTIIDN